MRDLTRAGAYTRPVAASPTPREPADCPSVPASTGPLTHLARLTISAPSTAHRGDNVPVTVRVEIWTDGPRVITTPATSAVLVVHGDRVVCRSAAPPSATNIPLIVRAGSHRPGQALPTAVRLTTGNSGDLPPGTYTLVGVLGYRLDPLNAAVDGGPLPQRSFALVSEPAPITVD
jgi:hypothetical protein